MSQSGDSSSTSHTNSADSSASVAATVGLRNPTARDRPPKSPQPPLPALQPVERRDPAPERQPARTASTSKLSAELLLPTAEGDPAARRRRLRVASVTSFPDAAVSLNNTGNQRARGPTASGNAGIEYWSPWVPSKDAAAAAHPTQSLVVTPVQDPPNPRWPPPRKTPRETAEPASSAGPGTVLDSGHISARGHCPSHGSNDSRRQYSLTMNAEHPAAAAVRHNGSHHLQRAHHHHRSALSARSIRSAPSSPASIPHPPSSSSSSSPSSTPAYSECPRDPSSMRPVPSETYYLAAGAEFSPVPRYKPQLGPDGPAPSRAAKQPSCGPRQSPNPLAAPGPRSVHSSNSSRSETKSHRSCPHPKSPPSNVLLLTAPGGTPEARSSSPGPFPSPPSDMGADGQLDRFKFRMARSKSYSTEYPPESLRGPSGGVNMDIDRNEAGGVGGSGGGGGGSIGRARPPLTSRTSSQYSKLVDASAIPLPNVTRRSSYSSATGISPVAEGYVANFPTASEPPQSPSRTASHRNALAIDTRVTQVDGPFGSPIKSPGSLPESPVAAKYADIQSPPWPAERRRVDDFEFVNTIEASPRPYTPDQFVIDAGILNKGATATRNSSQKSKRSLASFGALSKRSAGSQYAPPPNPNPIVQASPPRNVLRKKNPNAKNPQDPQMDASSLPSFDSLSRYSSRDRRGFLRSSLRSLGRPKELSGDPYSLDMPHTATTVSGPSRGLVVRESGFVSPPATDVRGPVPRAGGGSLFQLTRINRFFAGGKKSGHKTGPKLTTDSQKIPALFPSSSSSRRQKRSNTFAYLAASKKHPVRASTSSPSFTSTSEPPPPQASGSRGRSRRTAKTESNTSPSSASRVTPSPGQTSSVPGTQSFSTGSSSQGQSSGQPPFYGRPSVYRKGVRMVQQAWDNGWDAALEDFKERRQVERSYRYGVAGRKIKVYMSGALPNGSTASSSARGLASIMPWPKQRRRQNDKESGEDPCGQQQQEQQQQVDGLFFEHGAEATHGGTPTTDEGRSADDAEMEMSGLNVLGGSPDSQGGEKKSAFVELFERSTTSRERPVTSKGRPETSREQRPATSREQQRPAASWSGRQHPGSGGQQCS